MKCDVSWRMSATTGVWGGRLRRSRPRPVAPGLALIVVLAFASGCGAGGTGGEDPAAGRPIPDTRAASEPLGRPGAPVPGRTTAGLMVAAGSNAFGQLGTRAGPGSDRMRLVRSPTGGSLDGVVATAAGGRHSIAVLGEGRVFAWGANDNGQLGNGTRRDSDRPVPVMTPDGSAQLRGAVAVAADTDFSMALMGDGTVVTWGRSDAGQRGVGHTTPSPRPTTVLRPDGSGPLTGVVGIAADGRTAFALLRDGSVLGWGANDYGQVGDGTTRAHALPVVVRGLDGSRQLTGVVQIAAGGQHALALLGDGRVAAWGSNERGQLGDPARRTSSVPGLVVSPDGRGPLDDVVQVSSAERHNFALLRDGTVMGWGINRAGQMSDGSREERRSPGPVLLPDGQPLGSVSRVLAGEAYGVALLRDGTALTWGANGQGQLGQAMAQHSGRPRPVVLDGVGGRVVNAAPGERHLLLVVARK